MLAYHSTFPAHQCTLSIIIGGNCDKKLIKADCFDIIDTQENSYIINYANFALVIMVA